MPRYILVTVLKSKQRKNVKSSQRKSTHYKQEKKNPKSLWPNTRHSETDLRCRESGSSQSGGELFQRQDSTALGTELLSPSDFH